MTIATAFPAVSRILAELGLGIRLAFAGGRQGGIRTAMATFGVAVGAAALLLGASVPVLLDARETRTHARADNTWGAEIPAGRTTIVAAVESQWQDNGIRGRLIWPDTADSPLPPGVPAFPADQTMYVSPALRDALAGPDGATLRRQMPYEIAGLIAPQGLSGPHELAYYAGYQRVQKLVDGGSWRVDHFGETGDDEPSTMTYVLVATLLATLLLPVTVFIAAALRFGADTRDRRLAAIRLIGADSRAVLRIALGESLVPAGLGLALGAVFYLLARSRAADFHLFDVSVFPSDIHPVPSLAALVAVTVVLLSAVLTLLGFRGVAVEPLGVFRQAAVWRGRLWWRLVPLAASLALLYPILIGSGQIGEERTGLGVVLLVAAVIPLLPYLMPLAARVLPGGTSSWQLASQQLRRNPAASTRAVAGIVVAVAGAIALQSFFVAAAARRAMPDDSADPAFVLQATDRQSTDQMRQRTELFEQVEGVRAGTVAKYTVMPESPDASRDDYVIVGDCESLSQIATLDGCVDGDTFVAGSLEKKSMVLNVGPREPVAGPAVAVPAVARPARMIGSDAQYLDAALLLTPKAVPSGLAGADPWFVETRMFTSRVPEEVAGRLRGVAAEIDPLSQLTAIAPEADKYASLSTALDVGSTLILLMMTVGLLLDVAARLHERRRLLGVLSAVGARRATVVWSVLLQAFVPVVAGLALAVGVGAGLGALLMRLGEVPMLFRTSTVLTPAATGAAVVLLTTTAVLVPAARRVTRTEELRHE